MGRCERHQFEAAADRCGRCGHEFCGECIVYSFGPKKPPFCIPCAVAAAGIRSNASSRPVISRREAKRLEKDRRRAIRSGELQPAPMGAPEPELAYDWAVGE